MQLQDYELASGSFADYIAENPADYQVYRFLGDAQRSQKKLKAAYESYQKALAENEQDAHSYFGRGMVLLANKNLELAIGDFERAIELNPAKRYPNRLGLRCEPFGNL